MLFKKAVFALMAICIVFEAGGCWDAIDVNNKILVVTVITDMQGGELYYYIEAPNLEKEQNQQNSGGESSNFFTMFAKGSSYADVRRHMDAKADNPLYLGTVRALIITDELARFDIDEYMLRMQSDNQYRKALNIITSSSEPNEILSVYPPNNISVGESISESITTLKSLGKVVSYTISDILDFISSNTSFVLINMDVEDGLLTYNGYSIIRQSKMVGFIPVEESKGLVWLLGDNIIRIYTVPFDNCSATIQVKLSNKSFRPFYEDGKLVYDVKFKMNSELMNLSKNVKIDGELQKTIKDKLQNQIANDIAMGIKQSKEFQCDYLGFKESYRIKYPNNMKTIDWDDTYKNADFRIYVESTLEFGAMTDFNISSESMSQ